MRALVLLAVAAVAASSPALGAARRGCGPHVSWRRLVLISARTGAVDRSFADPDGSVNAIVPDEQGGWYIGGSFGCVGSTPRHGLAHLNSDGSLDRSWAAPVPAEVEALALAGTTLYAGGSFGVAAFDPATGRRRWLTRVSGGAVLALAANAERVYAGGAFSKAGGTVHRSLVALSPRTGAVLPWRTPKLDEQPYSTPTVTIGALALDGTRLFIGGDMTLVDGRPRFALAQLDARTGRLSPWTPPRAQGRWLVGDVATILVTHGRVFTAGHDGYGITSEQTGRLDPLTHGTYGYRFAAAGNLVYLAGNCRNSFTRIQGRPRNNLAALDLATRTVTGWAPNVQKYVCVDTLAADRDDVLVAGSFSATLG